MAYDASYLERILDRHDGVVYVYDLASGRNLYASGRWPETFGYSLEETRARPGFLLELIDPRDVAVVTAHLAGLRDAVDDQARTAEYRLRRKDGSQAWLRSTDRPFARDPDGRVREVVGVAHEITAQKEAEEARLESEARFRAIVERLPDAIFIADERGRLLEVNDAACEQLGYRRDELVGMAIADFIAPEYRERARARLAGRPTDAAPRAVPVESAHVRRDGTRIPVETVVLPMRLRNQPVLLGVARDISERTRLEGQLRDAQRLESIGRLAGAVAHDFNNVLTAILAGVAFLRDRSGLPAAARPIADDVVAAAQRGAELTRQLLTFGRRQRVDMKPTELSGLVGDTLRIVSRLLDGTIVLDAALTPGCYVHGDAGMLGQVVMNLALNARDAMPEGGTLRVEVAPGPDQRVWLHVTDTGCGIAAADLPHVFEPFYTTKADGGGTGLGLATVHGIVSQHGGEVVVESAPGRGSRFSVALPAGSPPVDTAPAPPTPTAGRALGVLLVEDQPDVRRVLRHALEDAGHAVWDADSAAAALHLWTAHEHEIALLVTDVALGDGVGGPTLAENLTARRPGLPVIFMSGFAPALANLRVTERHAFLAKPFEPSELLALIRSRVA